MAEKQLREDDEIVYGDSAYLGIEKRDEIKHNPCFSAIKFRINRRPGRLPKVSDNAIDWERYIEHRQSAVRCKVEHPYRIVKNIFGFRKAVYRELKKNLNRLHVLFASANLYKEILSSNVPRSFMQLNRAIIFSYVSVALSA